MELANNLGQVEFHADDFGLFPRQSRRILDCCSQGNLNGVSILPNGEQLPECMAMLETMRDRIAVTVHLNLIEGRCLSDPAQIPGLASADGILRGSFGRLLLQSYLPGRSRRLRELKTELLAQIRAVQAFLPQGAPLRLDGHAHYHMLPVVFDALMELIRQENIPVSYIRIPREYPSLYLRHWRQLRCFAPINLAKVMILNLLARRNRRKYAAYLSGLEQKVFLGVFFSGSMFRENVEPVLPDAMALAERLGWGLELLAHPGGVYEPEDIARLTCREDVEFLTSQHRRMEAPMFEI